MIRCPRRPSTARNVNLIIMLSSIWISTRLDSPILLPRNSAIVKIFVEDESKGRLPSIADARWSNSRIRETVSRDHDGNYDELQGLKSLGAWKTRKQPLTRQKPDRFPSGWSESAWPTGLKPAPRSFCIRGTCAASRDFPVYRIDEWRSIDAQDAACESDNRQFYGRGARRASGGQDETPRRDRNAPPSRQGRKASA